MMVRPFYLPLIAPPNVEPVNASKYYQAINTLATLTADFAGSGDALELTITNSGQPHPAGQVVPALPLSSVYAVTSGFVRYYPSAEVLPTPDQQPIGLPNDLVTPQEIGSLVIRVWLTDFRYLMRMRSAATPRPNRIVLGRVQKTSVGAAFSREIKNLKPGALMKAWEDGGGSGTPPDDEGLRVAFLQRLMAGTAEIFVQAGTPIGEASLVTDPDGSPSQVAHMKLQAFFAPDDPSGASLPVPVEDLIDTVMEDTGRSTYFDGHPLLAAINGPLTVNFQSHFWIRDNALRTYAPFAGKQVTLMRNNEEKLTHTTTDAAGKIDLPGVALLKGDVIWFELATDGEKLGLRQFKTNVRTNSHKARWYLDSNGVNTNLYRAGYKLHPGYAQFVDKLVANEADEKFGLDRGNARSGDTSTKKIYGTGAFLYSTQRQMLRRIKDSEESFTAHVLPDPAKTFTLLVEGDSWLNYPLVQADIYEHLDELLKAGRKKGVRYNVFPLQHSGDRSDQMFLPGTPAVSRQWDFTIDLLSEYKIDLILCSAGGNDLAEPGISPNDAARYGPLFTGAEGSKYFDSLSAFAPGSPLSAPDQTVAMRLIERSFASLLNTHPWHTSVKGKGSADHQKVVTELLPKLKQQLNDLNVDLGESDLTKQSTHLQEIGDSVIAKMNERSDLPDVPVDKYDALLETVFDLVRYRARFDSVKGNLQLLMDLASALRIPVLMHTYSYPLYNERGTTYFEEGKNPLLGPWFTPRFIEAGIDDRRVHKICLKALLDHFVAHILKPFKKKYKEVSPDSKEDFRFDYIDVRETSKEAYLWRDEMHLQAPGYRRIAKLLYASIAERFPHLFSA